MTTTRTAPTISIQRTMKAPAQRIYKAFLDPEVLKRYQAPEGTEAIYGAFTAQVGAENEYAFKSGDRQMQFRIKFLELVEFTLIRHTYHMAMPGPDVEMEIKITLEETDDGTVVRFEQWGLPQGIPVDGASAGWGGMLDRLKALVEA